MTWPLLAAGGTALAPTEELVAQGLERAKEVIAEVIEFQEEFLAQAGVKPSDFEPHPLYGQDLWDALTSFSSDFQAAENSGARVRNASSPSSCAR